MNETIEKIQYYEPVISVMRRMETADAWILEDEKNPDGPRGVLITNIPTPGTRVRYYKDTTFEVAGYEVQDNVVWLIATSDRRYPANKCSPHEDAKLMEEVARELAKTSWGSEDGWKEWQEEAYAVIRIMKRNK